MVVPSRERYELHLFGPPLPAHLGWAHLVACFDFA